jgi:hypothetical protein
MKLFELHFRIPYPVLFCSFGLKIIGYENSDNNLESLCKNDSVEIVIPVNYECRPIPIYKHVYIFTHAYTHTHTHTHTHKARPEVVGGETSREE